jgi:hypothetical protein
VTGASTTRKTVQTNLADTLERSVLEDEVLFEADEVYINAGGKGEPHLDFDATAAKGLGRRYATMANAKRISVEVVRRMCFGSQLPLTDCA